MFGGVMFAEVTDGQPELAYSVTVVLTPVAVTAGIPTVTVATGGGTDVTVVCSPVAVTVGTPTVTVTSDLTVSVTVVVPLAGVTVGFPSFDFIAPTYRLISPRVRRTNTIGSPRNRSERLANRLMRHYSPPWAEQNVWVYTDGTISTRQPPSNETVEHVYFGGHINIVGPEEKDRLEAAGFTLELVEPE